MFYLARLLMLLLLLISQVLCLYQNFFTTSEILHSLTNSFCFIFTSSINCVTCKFFLINSSEIHSFNVFYFCVLIFFFFLPKPPISEFLFSTSLIFAKTEVVTNPLVSGIFVSTNFWIKTPVTPNHYCQQFILRISDFSLQVLFCLCCIDLFELK